MRYILFLFLIINAPAFGQNVDEIKRDGSFSYQDEQTLKSRLNQYDKHYGGFSIRPAADNEELFGVFYMLFYEYGYLLMPKNDAFNVSLNAMPQISLIPLGGFSIPVSINANFGSEASTEFGDLGLSLGFGYDAVFVLPDYNESSPFFRMGIGVENFYCSFQYNSREQNFFRYAISAGVKFDW